MRDKTESTQAGPEPARECLAGACGHGRPQLWNIRRMRWEIPESGPCRKYQMIPRPARSG